MRKKSSGFLFLSKFWLTVGVIVLAVLSLGASQPPSRVAGGELPEEVAKVAQGRPYALTATPEPLKAKPKPKPAAKQQIASMPVPKPVPRPELVGTVGYAVAGGNCVNEPGVNNPGYGNPSDWPVTSQEPTVGATAVFTWNHVGVVTGIWANGDVEVRHQNFWGGQHRFPRSTFRGFR
ncbi:MAG TPA: CHAP domain-containing protein [Patescibacteria group bacterium]|jgi:hypothetical protein